MGKHQQAIDLGWDGDLSFLAGDGATESLMDSSVVASSAVESSALESSVMGESSVLSESDSQVVSEAFQSEHTARDTPAFSETPADSQAASVGADDVSETAGSERRSS